MDPSQLLLGITSGEVKIKVTKTATGFEFDYEYPDEMHPLMAAVLLQYIAHLITQDIANAVDGKSPTTAQA